MRKRFADDPTDNRKQSGVLKDLATSPIDQNGEEEIILYNEVSANRYEV